MIKGTMKICSTTKSCINFKKINNLIIKMITGHYFDLQMYSNFIFDIDNEPTDISAQNNFYSRIVAVRKKYNPQYQTMPLFAGDNMENLKNIVINIVNDLADNNISVPDYLSDIDRMEFFGSGALSSAILFKIYRRTQDNEIRPLIIKLIPLQFPQYYQYLQFLYQSRQSFIQKYIESPSYALFIKEAWMYCFSKNELLKYAPTFTCISNCYIINGLPIENLQALYNMYIPYEQKRRTVNKPPIYKKWFNILINPKQNIQLQKEIMTSDYGCFEMAQIEKTLEDIYNESGLFDLSIIFEYLYTKVVAAFIGRIIFTDDHFGNIAYRTVNYTRSYKIKCNGCNYFFYMPPGKMIQFIDLERYVFNFSRYDIYTNTALQNIPGTDFDNTVTNLNRIKKSYDKNEYIFDKSLSALLNKSFSEKNFSDVNEYKIMLKILTSPFIHDIKTFCQIMESNLPRKYLTAPNNITTVEYYIDLDDNSLRVIDLNMLYKNI